MPTLTSTLSVGGRCLASIVPDDLRSSIKHHLLLHRIDPGQAIRRFYSLVIERDLFGTIRLVRNWGRIGTNGQELVEVFASEIEAGLALEAIAQAKRVSGFVTPAKKPCPFRGRVSSPRLRSLPKTEPVGHTVPTTVKSTKC